MTFPSLLFALVLALLCGVLFHALRGGGAWSLFLYIGLSALGFALSQWIGNLFNWNLFVFGTVDIGSGVVGSAVALLLGEWLIRPERAR